MYFSNQSAENVKMYLRGIYAFLVWYEVIYMNQKEMFDDDWDYDEDDYADQWMERKLPIVILGSVCLLHNFIEKCCYAGTRMVVMFGGFWFVVHFTLALQNITWPWFTIINNGWFTLMYLYWFMRWLKYGESDMSSFMTHGPFRPGLKRFKSEHGNDCMAFYPVNKSIPPVQIDAYFDKKATEKGGKLSGLSTGLGRNWIYNRKVNGLVPEGPLDPIFATGEKKLIPIVYCHGNQSNGEEAYGVSMILASHGYLVISLDFMDGTALNATDKNGKEVLFQWPEGQKKGMKINGKPNMELHNGHKVMQDQNRVVEAQALGRQIKSPGFAKNVLNFNCGLDTDKMTVCGYSLGGWTSILAASGDQDVFKCSLSFDPSHVSHLDEINADQIIMKHPTFISQSNFLEKMVDNAFGFTGSRQSYLRYLEKFKTTIPDSKNNLQAVFIRDTQHADFGDKPLYVQYEMTWFNAMQGVPFDRKQGTGTQVHEFAVCLWLEFLLKVGMHNNTFTMSNIVMRLQQFRDLLQYDHRIGDGMSGNVGQTAIQMTDQSVPQVNESQMALKPNYE